MKPRQKKIQKSTYQDVLAFLNDNIEKYVVDKVLITKNIDLAKLSEFVYGRNTKKDRKALYQVIRSSKNKILNDLGSEYSGDPQQYGHRYDRSQWFGLLQDILPQFADRFFQNKMASEDWNYIKSTKFNFQYGAPTADAIRLFATRNHENLSIKLQDKISKAAVQARSPVKISIVATGNLSLELQHGAVASAGGQGSPPDLTLPSGNDKDRQLLPIDNDPLPGPGLSKKKRHRRRSFELLSPDRCSIKATRTRRK